MAAGAQAQNCVLVLLLLLCMAAVDAAQASNHEGLAARIGRMLAGMRSLRQSGGSSSSNSNKQATAAPGLSSDNPRQVTLDVTTGERSPDCVSRKVILINGQFQPTLTFTQGDWVEITVKNNIGADWPSLFDGISVHWHGFSMKGFAWMDGTKYVAQCPIARGSSFTYKFQVNEMPGTYFYHDHSNHNRGDGLQGALVVKERPGTPQLFEADADETLFLSDWWHFAGNSMALRLNRPFDPTKATSDTGAWCWVGLPKSILINGQGNYYNCEDVYKREVNATLPYRPSDKPVPAAAKDLMSPNACVAGQLGPTAEPAACDVSIGASKCSSQQRPQITVKPGSTARVRLVNAATLVYMTVCFEKHSVTVVALDAAPVEPKTFSECVDINSGQRVDVLLKADQPSDRTYWISVGSQYRKGAPSGYGVIKYSGSSSSGPDPATIVSPAAVVDKKWTTDVFNSFKANSDVLKASDSSGDSKTTSSKAAAAYLAPSASGISTFKLPKKDVDQRYVLESTQPIIQANGMLRWAFNNIAHASTPPCQPVLDSVHADAQWAAVDAVKPGAASAAANSAAYLGKIGGDAASLLAAKDSRLQVVDEATASKDVFIKLGTPSAATHVLTVQPGEVVEIVIQNDRAGLFGGEYASNSTLTSARNGREQHSFHLHGYHFWQVGMGMGAWSPDKVSTYNLEDPPLRDTNTVLFNGTTEDKAAWVALRFVGSNPGVWPLHCHIDWHMYMGQGINIISDPAGIARSAQPKHMPQCPKQCHLNFGNTNPKASEKLAAGMAAPLASNLP